MLASTWTVFALGNAIDNLAGAISYRAKRRIKNNTNVSVSTDDTAFARGLRDESGTERAHLISRIPGGAREHGQEKRDDDVSLDNVLEALEDEGREGLQAQQAHLWG